MTHEKIYQEFKKIFAMVDDNIVEWKPARKDSIYLKYKNGEEYIFRFRNKHSFSFETVEHFIEREE